jgi:hypothetical protein
MDAETHTVGLLSENAEVVTLDLLLDDAVVLLPQRRDLLTEGRLEHGSQLLEGHLKSAVRKKKKTISRSLDRLITVIHATFMKRSSSKHWAGSSFRRRCTDS